MRKMYGFWEKEEDKKCYNTWMLGFRWKVFDSSVDNQKTSRPTAAAPGARKAVFSRKFYFLCAFTFIIQTDLFGGLPQVYELWIIRKWIYFYYDLIFLGHYKRIRRYYLYKMFLVYSLQRWDNIFLVISKSPWLFGFVLKLLW